MDCSPSGASVHGILQARILEWGAIPFSRGSSQPTDQTQVSCIAGRFSTAWAKKIKDKIILFQSILSSSSRLRKKKRKTFRKSSHYNLDKVMLIWWNWQWVQEIESDPITSWQIKGETVEAETDIIFLGSKTTVDGACSHEIKRHLQLGRKAMTNLVQLLSRVQLFATPWTAARQASLSITNSRSLLKLMSIESVMPSNQLILCCPLLLPPSILPSIRVFAEESVLHIRWPKYRSFSFSISPSNEYSGLIPLGLTGWISWQSKGLSRVFSNTTAQKHQFFSTQLS